MKILNKLYKLVDNHKNKIVVNTVEHARKLRDEQTKHNQTRLQYNDFLKSLAYKYNPLFFI